MIVRAVLLALSMVALALPSRAAQPALETVRIGIPGKLVDFSPYFVGIKTGIYRSEWLDPQFVVMRSGIIIAALLSGELDYTTLYGSTIRAAVSGLPLKIISTLITRQSFFLFAQPEIKRVQDLKGKRIAISGFASSTDNSARGTQTLRTRSDARCHANGAGRYRRALSSLALRRHRGGDPDAAVHRDGGAQGLEQLGLARRYSWRRAVERSEHDGEKIAGE